MNKLTKVRVLKTHPNIEIVFKVGDIIHIKAHLYEEDTVIVNERRALDKETGLWYTASPATIAPKGSYKKSTFITADGQEWDGDTFIRVMGPNNGAYDKVFEKIKE